jgi:hypothetical protein
MRERYCGWLRIPAPPNGWLKPNKIMGCFPPINWWDFPGHFESHTLHFNPGDGKMMKHCMEDHGLGYTWAMGYFQKIQTEGQFGRGLCPTAWLGHTRAYSAKIDRWKSVAVIHCNHVTTCLEFPTTTGLYRLFLGYCAPSMKLSYHSEVIGTYSPFHS